MPVYTAPGGGHPIAAESCKLRFGILLTQLRDQRRSMHVTGCLSCYNEVLTQFSGNITTSNTLPEAINCLSKD